MIVRFANGGKSFKGLAVYLTHDPDKAKTTERVAWTHTLNLANDHIASAVHEMLWSCRAAEQLKRQAGIPTGGRKLENPVKHFSLNWAPSDKPTQEEMIEAVQDILRHLGWHEHQAVLVSHKDKHYSHVHVVLNAVNPHDGRSLDTGYEHSRASAWALRYEQERFRVHCKERLKPYEARESSPDRASWLKMKEAERAHEQAELERVARTPEHFERDDRSMRDDKEWQLLKSHQRQTREAFFMEGRDQFIAVRKAVFREVRSEFREEWKHFYEAKREGIEADKLATMKAEILARQNAELEMRRDAECKELRTARDLDYRLLLEHQKQERTWLAERQEQGIATPQLLGMAYRAEAERREADQPIDRDAGRQLGEEFREAGRETTEPKDNEPVKEPANAAEERSEPESLEAAYEEPLRVRNGLDVVGGLGLGALGGIATVAERLFDGFLGGPPRGAPRNVPAPDQTGAKAQRQTNARAAEKQARAVAEEASEAERLHAYWQERRRKRERDR